MYEFYGYPCDMCGLEFEDLRHDLTMVYAPQVMRLCNGTVDPRFDCLKKHDAMFRAWLPGIIDGEGHFSITESKGRWRCGLTIKLRDDDRPVLMEIARQLGIRGQVRAASGVGTIVGHPQARLDVCRKEDVVALAELLGRKHGGLWTRKREQCLIWRKAVELWDCVDGRRGNEPIWSQMSQRASELIAARQYRTPGP